MFISQYLTPFSHLVSRLILCPSSPLQGPLPSRRQAPSSYPPTPTPWFITLHHSTQLYCVSLLRKLVQLIIFTPTHWFITLHHGTQPHYVPLSGKSSASAHHIHMLLLYYTHRHTMIKIHIGLHLFIPASQRHLLD